MGMSRHGQGTLVNTTTPASGSVDRAAGRVSSSDCADYYDDQRNEPWLVGWLACWLYEWLAGLLEGWLASWLANWLASLLTG